MSAPKSNWPLIQFIIKETNKKGFCDAKNFDIAFMCDLQEEQVIAELQYLYNKGLIDVLRDDFGHRHLKVINIPSNYQGVRPQNRLF
jgi:hypothetical protein